MRSLRYFVVLIAFSSTYCFACMCGFPRPNGPQIRTMRELAEWQASRTDAAPIVFEGTVAKQKALVGSVTAPAGAESYTPAGTYRIVTFSDVRLYRGPERAQYVLVTGMGTGDCGYDFETGVRYLVFAVQAQDGLLFTSICTGPTNPVDEAGPWLRFLRGEPPTSDDLLDPVTYNAKFVSQHTGSVCGKVLDSAGSPVRGAAVTLWKGRKGPFPGHEFSDPNLSKPDGTFCIPAVDPGTYLLMAEADLPNDNNERLISFYADATTQSDATSVDVQGGKTVRDLALKLHHEQLYTVHVRVVTADGRPIPPRLKLALDSPENNPLSDHDDDWVDKNGNCTFYSVPAGHYSLTPFFEPEDEDEVPQVVKEQAEWQTATRQVDLLGNSEIFLKLSPKQ